MKSANSKTIIFITGAFFSHTVWEEWEHYFKTRGYKTYSPWWPHKDAPAEVLNKRNPDPDLAALRLKELVQYFESYINNLPEKPFIIAEGLGGLVTQILMKKQAVLGFTLINSWPIGSSFPLCTRSMFLFASILGTFKLHTTYRMTDKMWRQLFLLDKTSKNVVDRHYRVPESRMLIWDVLRKKKISLKSVHTPCLIIATQNSLVPFESQSSYFMNHFSSVPYSRFQAFENSQPPGVGYNLDIEIAEYIDNWMHKISIILHEMPS